MKIMILKSCIISYLIIINPNSRFMQSLDGIHFQYTNSAGNRDTIKIEINYSLRAHILESVEVNTITRIFDDNIIIRTVAPLEIFAAKGNALINRAAARDLYDFSNMIEANMFDGRRDLFRKAIVFYASISSTTINRTFDTREIDSIDFGKIKRDLFPVIEIKPNFEEW